MGRKVALPTAQNKDRLIIQELPDEIIIYDKVRHKAFYLDQPTALVWKHCDGTMNVREMARLLEAEIKSSCGDLDVKAAISNLKKFKLL